MKPKMPPGAGIHRRAITKKEKTDPARSRFSVALEKANAMIQAGSVKSAIFIMVDDDGNLLSGVKVINPDGFEAGQMLKEYDRLKLKIYQEADRGLNESSFSSFDED